MTKYLTPQWQERFWEAHGKAREKLEKKWRELPFSEKCAIVEKLQSTTKVLQEARQEVIMEEQFGLGELPLDACNKFNNSEFIYTEFPKEDLDISFKPKKTRTAKGVVVKRGKAKFKTAFDVDAN